MTTKARRLTLLLVALGLLFVLLIAFFSGPGDPHALLRVVDATGKPIAGAIIRPEGLRTKPGPYSGGWYGWNAFRTGVPTDPATTDSNGYARLRYPKYVFEHVETGTICLRVEHPDFVPDRPAVAGAALLLNLPREAKEFSVVHSQFAMPAKIKWGKSPSGNHDAESGPNQSRYDLTGAERTITDCAVLSDNRSWGR